MSKTSMITPDVSIMKRSSYPSRQLRGGPAPLASFEDLSDEIPSPEDLETEQRRLGGGGDERPKNEDDDADDDDDDDEEEDATYSDGATPSTPRVLAQTPSTPLTLDNSFSIGTPDSLDDFHSHSNSREIGGSNTSRADSPSFHSNESTTTITAITSNIKDDEQSGTPLDEETSRPLKKCGASTPSPRTARKLFTMSFFKPRTADQDRSPSPMKSPNSPRRLSPSAISPKSPRRLSSFGGLFRSGKDHLEVFTGTSSSSSTDQQPSSCTIPTSPTKKKGGGHHLPQFLRPKDDSKKSQSGPDSSTLPTVVAPPVKKDGGAARYATVFANLFRKGDGQVSGRSMMSPTSSTTDDKSNPVCGHILNGTEKVSSSPKTRMDESQPASNTSPAIAVVETGAANIYDLNMFESSHDIAEGLEFDPNLRLGLSPSADGQAATTPFSDSPKHPIAVLRQVDAGVQPSSDAASAVVEDNRTSPTESEPEVPDESDPNKTAVKGDEPEAETLLREDSFEIEEFGAEDGNDLVASTTAAEKIEQATVTKHRDKIASFRTNPLERPRSTAPVNFASLDAYIDIVSTRRRLSVTDAAELEANVETEKLKVILPGEEFEHKPRQTKKPGTKTWFEFCELGLQSPRTRRRQIAGGNERASSAPSATRTSSVTVDDRCKLADFGFSASSDAWVTFDLVSADSPKRTKEDVQVSAKFTSKSLPRPPKSFTTTTTMSSSSSSDSCPSQPALQECDVKQNGSNSSSKSRSSSDDDESRPMKVAEVIDAMSLNVDDVDDDEVEPLVGPTTVSLASPPEYFLPSNGDFAAKAWTMTTTSSFSPDDVHFSSSVPDCVASASIRQEDVDDLEHSPLTDFFNGGIDLLASIPPISKFPSDGSTVSSSGSFRRPAPPPPPPRTTPGGVRSTITSRQNM